MQFNNQMHLNTDFKMTLFRRWSLCNLVNNRTGDRTHVHVQEWDQGEKGMQRQHCTVDDPTRGSGLVWSRSRRRG